MENLFSLLQVRAKCVFARDVLAAQMSHTPATQDAFYLLIQRKLDAVGTVQVIKEK